MRCIFTFFAEDIHLLPHDSFSNLLDTLGDNEKTLQNFKPMVESLWQTMNTGGFSPDPPRARPALQRRSLRIRLKHSRSTARQFDLLRLAARMSEWKDVEPAIFGTLLERALDERERHSLGAHYTPRAYVERLGRSHRYRAASPGLAGRPNRRRLPGSFWEDRRRYRGHLRNSASNSAPSRCLTPLAAPATFST